MSDLRRLVLPVGAAVVVLLLVVFWMLFHEVFAFGVQAGEKPGSIQDVPIVRSIDTFFTHVPVLGEKARTFLHDEEDVQDPDSGPQLVWRDYAKWWGILMFATAFLMLIVKRVAETVDDETTVMHLKGDTDTALRAKGGRG